MIDRLRRRPAAGDEPPVSLGPTDDAPSGGRWVLLTVALGTTLAPLNSTMIAVALPDIQRDFATSVTTTAWLVTLYLVTMAIGQPITGRLGDLLGRRRVYFWGLAAFAVASAGCAFAPSLPLLILFRTSQAVAAALTVPNGTAIIREIVPHHRRGAAFGTIGLATGTAAAIGPPLGGLLVHLFGWQAIFWANVPVVVVTGLLGLRHLPKPTIDAPAGTANGRGAFDIVGSGLLALALSGLLIVPTLLRLDRAVLAIVSGVAGVVVGAIFFSWERRHRSPVVEVALFKVRNFSAACGSIFLSNLVMYTSLLALPLYLEVVREQDPRTTGLILTALSGIAALTGPLGGQLADRVGRRLPATLGAVALVGGAGMQAFAVGGTHLWPLAIALGLMGIGIGIQGAPVHTTAIEASSSTRAGAAAGVFSTSRYLGSVTGASILAVVLAARPSVGDDGRFVGLFVGITVAAVVGVFVNSVIGDPALSTTARPRSESGARVAPSDGR